MGLISREEAIKQIDEAFDIGECYSDKYAIHGILRSLPTIEERKEGAWIILEEPIEGKPKRWRVKCPFCRKRLRITDKKLWEFCPCCGARMKGE